MSGAVGHPCSYGHTYQWGSTASCVGCGAPFAMRRGQRFRAELITPENPAILPFPRKTASETGSVVELEPSEPGRGTLARPERASGGVRIAGDDPAPLRIVEQRVDPTTETLIFLVERRSDRKEVRVTMTEAEEHGRTDAALLALLDAKERKQMFFRASQLDEAWLAVLEAGCLHWHFGPPLSSGDVRGVYACHPEPPHERLMWSHQERAAMSDVELVALVRSRFPRAS